MSTYPVEIVEWVDATSNDGWTDKHKLEDEFDEDLTVYSVGFIIYESEDRIVLLSHDGGKQWSTTITIPVVCILRRVKMERAGELPAL